MCLGEEDTGGPSSKKPKGTSVDPEKKRKRTKAPITRITALEAGEIEKEASEGWNNRVIFTSTGAFQFTFPPVSREDAVRTWELFLKSVSKMQDGINEEVFHTEFSADELECLDMRAAYEFFPSLATVDGHLRARAAKAKDSLVQPLAGSAADKQQLQRLKSRGALFKRIGNAAQRQAKAFEEAAKKTHAQIQSNLTVTPVTIDTGEAVARNSVIQSLRLDDSMITAEDHNEVIRCLWEYLSMITERLRQELAVQVIYINRHAAAVAEKESNLLRILDYSLEHLGENFVLPHFLDHVVWPAHLCKCERCVPVEQPLPEQNQESDQVERPLQLIMRPGAKGLGLEKIVWGPKAIARDVVVTIWTAKESPASVCNDFFTLNCPGWAQEDYRTWKEDPTLEWSSCNQGLDAAHEMFQGEIDTLTSTWRSETTATTSVDLLTTEKDYQKYLKDFAQELEEEAEDEASSSITAEDRIMIQQITDALDKYYQEAQGQWESLPLTAVLRNQGTAEENESWEAWKYRYTTSQGQRDKEELEKMQRELDELRAQLRRD